MMGGKPLIRKSLIVLSGTILLFGVVAFVAYRHWEPDFLVREAQAFLAKGDDGSAALEAQRALQLDPTKVDACRIVAAIMESKGQPEAIEWRRRIVQLAPDSLDDKLAWVATALRFHQPSVAQEALALVKEKEKMSKGELYESSAGAVAVACGNFEEAQKHYREALRLNPQAESNQLNYANALLDSPVPEERASALSILKRLCDSQKFRLLALRVLTTDLATHHQLSEALKFSSELQADAQATFSDRVNHLDLLLRTGGTDFASSLKSLEDRASAAPQEAGMLMAWMDTNRLADQATNWAKRLPAQVIATPQTGAGLAACYISVKDWEGLRTLAAKSNWGDLDYLRLAFLTRALKELGDSDGSQTQWGAAETAAAAKPGGLKELVRLVDLWGWKSETIELLTKAAEGERDQEWALQLLYRFYSRQGDTRQMCWVAARTRQVDPTNDTVDNNFAILSLLLGSEVDHASAIARKLYEKDPGNAVFASTYAYSLYLTAKTDEALRIMRALRVDQLRDPSIAAYYGILLAASGSRVEALKFFNLAKNATLLPEEKQLIAAAIERLH
jgi:tetratricopeptide (TPR) repeat protein